MSHRKDIPFRLLAAMVARMPEDRREWGEAMLAELAPLQGSGSRWSFAVSCLRVALFPPGRYEPHPFAMIKNLLPVVGVIALAGFALLQPEISGAGLAWAYMIYGLCRTGDTDSPVRKCGGAVRGGLGGHGQCVRARALAQNGLAASVWTDGGGCRVRVDQSRSLTRDPHERVRSAVFGRGMVA